MPTKAITLANALSAIMREKQRESDELEQAQYNRLANEPFMGRQRGNDQLPEELADLPQETPYEQADPTLVFDKQNWARNNADLREADADAKLLRGALKNKSTRR